MGKFKQYALHLLDILPYILLILFVDLFTKLLFDKQSIVIIEGVFSFTSSYNTGAAFSMFSGKVIYLIIFTFVYLFIFLLFDFFESKKTTSKLYLASLSLIVGGAIGNLIDRIAFGYVRDFIFFEFINFPIFNVADICLTFGVILLMVYTLFFARNKKKNEV